MAQVGSELGHVLVRRASAWLDAVEEARGEAARRLHAEMDAPPAHVDAGALEVAIRDAAAAGGVGDTPPDPPCNRHVTAMWLAEVRRGGRHHAA